MVDTPRLIVQLPRGSEVERQLSANAPPSVASGEVVVTVLASDEHGHLEPPDAGEVVLSVPSPETLAREAAEVRRVIALAGSGDEALVIVVEVAEELREDELAAVLDAAGHTARGVILRVMRDA
jgi:pyruvate-formate lyase-activating enzyme